MSGDVIEEAFTQSTKVCRALFYALHNPLDVLLYESLFRVPETPSAFQPRTFSCSHYKVKLTANSCIALSNSKNALSFSSACTMKRLPSSRCASVIQIVRPSKSRAETQLELHPALWRLSAMISQDLTGTAAFTNGSEPPAVRVRSIQAVRSLSEFAPSNQ
jgi:hypothetical protein